MNLVDLNSLKWRTPYKSLTVTTPDISMIYRFKFWDKILFKRDESRGGKFFTYLSDELSEHFVGFSESVGNEMTYKVFTDETNKIIYISTSDPVTCDLYERENGLLNLPGWNRFRPIVENKERLMKIVNQSNLQVFQNYPNYKYGIGIPTNHNHAMELDRLNRNSLWSKSEVLEISQIGKFNCFKDMGRGTNIPGGYKFIRVHMVYDIKNDHRHKVRLVANGKLTGTPDQSVYSSVVSLRGLRITLFLS